MRANLLTVRSLDPDFGAGRLLTRLLKLLLCVILMSSAVFAEKYALLVGINEYTKVRPLRGSLNDIAQIKQILIHDLEFSEDKIRILIDEDATKENILSALDSLATQTKAGDSLFWYYSGHGFMMLDENGDEAFREAGDRYDEILVPYDAAPWPRERATDPNPTMLSDDEIARALSGMDGKRVVIIFDSCHSGSATRAVGDANGRSLYPGFVPSDIPRTKSLVHPTESLDLGGPLVFISAASPLQSASDMGEFDGERHGAFTASLLRSINKSGPDWHRTLSWDGLFRLAKEDLLNQGFSGQTPSIQTTGGLAKRPIDEFLNPPASSEIADLDSPKGAFEVQLESRKYLFSEGDLLTLAVQSERNGYLYIFDINAEKKITQLFPNQFTPENSIQAGQLRTIPSERDPYQFRAGSPFGKSVVVAVVTTEPWSRADQLQMPDDFRPITDSQQAGLREQFRLLHDAARSGSGDSQWASQKMVLEIVPADHVQQPAEEWEMEELEPEETATVTEATQADTSPVQATSGRTEVSHEAPPPVSASLPPAADVAASESGAESATAASVSASSDASLLAPLPTLVDIEDAGLSWEDQLDLLGRKPALFGKLQQLAERYSPVFWQDVSGDFDKKFQPWKDFVIRYDFDLTEEGPNWPEPPRFQDEIKRERSHFLDEAFSPNSSFKIETAEETQGMYRVQNTQAGETVQLDLRPFVYWTVLTTSSHFFFHYVVFHAEDWKGLFGHTGDLEGTTIVVDRVTERMVAAFTLAHDDVNVVRSLDEDPGPNIGILVDPELESRGLLDEGDDRPVDGILTMEVTRGGEASPKEHQDIYIETKGHGQHGPKKIKKSRYIIYATYLDDSTFTAPSFERDQYPQTDSFSEVLSKHKYELIYIGSGGSSEQTTLWGEYRTLKRFGGGVNPPWNWRDNWWFKTGWWKNPRRIKKIGDKQYRINPYLEP